MTVTLATGRLSSSTLPVAQDLALTTPLVCADGAVLYCPTRATCLAVQPLSPDAVNALVTGVQRHGLAPFVFTHEAVHGSSDDAERYGWIAGWTPQVRTERPLQACLAGEEAFVIAIGVGDEAAVKAAHQQLQTDLGARALAGDLAVFPIGGTGHWVVRLTPAGRTKATGLADLIARLEIRRQDVAVIGDWYNDQPMFEWAGTSFAMGHAPDDLKRAATHTVRATASTGGGVCQALEILFAHRGEG